MSSPAIQMTELLENIATRICTFAEKKDYDESEEYLKIILGQFDLLEARLAEAGQANELAAQLSALDAPHKMEELRTLVFNVKKEPKDTDANFALNITTPARAKLQQCLNQQTLRKQNIDAEIEKCVAYLQDTRQHTAFPLFPNLPLFINKYRDARGYTLLHMAIETGNSGLVGMMLRQKPELFHQTAEGMFPFGLENARTLSMSIMNELLFEDSKWRTNSQYIQQLSHHCQVAIKDHHRDLLSLCLPVLLKTETANFTLTHLVYNTSQSPLVWLCITPEYLDMLEHYVGLLQTHNALYGPRGFWTVLAKQLYECENDAEGSDAYRAFRQKTGATSVTLLELALLHNTKAAEFLIRKDLDANLNSKSAELLEKIHTQHFANDPKRSTALFDFVIARHVPDILTQEDCLLLQCMVPAMRSPQLLQRIHDLRVDLFTPYRPKLENQQCVDLKRLLQRLILTYFARTYDATENHGAAGIKCATTLLTRILEANTSEQVWAEVANLLLKEPKKNLQINSLRALILRTVNSDANHDRAACLPTPAQFQLPAECTSWDKTTQITIGLLIRSGTHQSYRHRREYRDLMGAITTGTRTYLLQYPKLTEGGVVKAAARWHALALATQPKPFLDELITCLTNSPGTTHTATSHRIHLISAIVADAHLCRVIKYDRAAEHKSMQDDLVKALNDYRNRKFPKTSLLGMFARGTTQKDGNNDSEDESWARPVPGRYEEI